MSNLQWHPVARFTLSLNLSPLLRALKNQGIHSRVTEERGVQQLWILEAQQVNHVKQFAQAWAQGDINLKSSANSDASDRDISTFAVFDEAFFVTVKNLLRNNSLCLALVALGFVGLLLVLLDSKQLQYVSGFLFLPLWSQELPAAYAHHWWRLITPIFLHFHLLHWLFNAVMLWAMGKRIEQHKGSLHFLLLVLVMGLVSNIAQYHVGQSIFFGGLSGVVFGLGAYLGVYQHFQPHTPMQFPKAVLVFMLLWLALGYSGVVDWFISGQVANTAHLAGLLTGAVLGAVAVIADRSN